jgi:uncharacterized protein
MSSPGVRQEILVFAKEPRAGQSKTRLCPPLLPSEAAVLAEAMLTDTLLAVAECSAARHVLVLEGAPGPWLPEGFVVREQRGRNQAERIAAAFTEAQGPALLIGMDTPQVTPGGLSAALQELSPAGVDAVLGYATDGGWWALGMRRPDGRVVSGVPMSSPDTGRLQRRRLGALGLSCSELPELQDVDTIDDAVAVAKTIPDSLFAKAVVACLDKKGTDPALEGVVSVRQGDRRSDSACLDLA